MRMKYVSKIQGKLKSFQTIQTDKTTSNVLDGSYNSVFKGKSMNFDELREYVVGDDIRDIDWKASSRGNKMLVRQYVAEKKHSIMFVFDTNRKMLADTRKLEEKRDVAIMAAGTIALFVNRNNDYIASAFATGKSLSVSPFRTGLGNIEMMLQNYHKEVTDENNSDLNYTLDYIVRNFKRKMIIVILSDLEGINSISESTLKRLLIMNDVLMVNVSDAELGSEQEFDIAKREYVGDFFSKDKKLKKIAAAETARLIGQCTQKLNKYGVSCAYVNSEDDCEQAIVRMLERHRFDKGKKSR